jgi:hypothetical protein
MPAKSSMPEGRAGRSPEAATRRLALRRALGAHWPSLRVVAENLLGAETRIDLVGVGADGETLLVLQGEPGRDLELVARGLAQRAWVEARLGDWLQLAPELRARPESGVAALLLCSSFGPEALAAAGAAGPGQIRLAVCHFAPEGPELRAFIAPIERVAGRPAAVGVGPDQPRAEFRTGLCDADLGLSAEERSALEPAAASAPREPASTFQPD